MIFNPIPVVKLSILTLRPKIRKLTMFSNGTTSFSAKGFDDVTWWIQGKLAEDTV